MRAAPRVGGKLVLGIGCCLSGGICCSSCGVRQGDGDEEIISAVIDRAVDRVCGRPGLGLGVFFIGKFQVGIRLLLSSGEIGFFRHVRPGYTNARLKM